MDCEKLVSIRNQWTSQPYNYNLHPSHPILNWGQGETTKIEDWEGVYIQDGRVTELSLPFSYNLEDIFPSNSQEPYRQSWHSSPS